VSNYTHVFKNTLDSMHAKPQLFTGFILSRRMEWKKHIGCDSACSWSMEGFTLYSMSCRWV